LILLVKIFLLVKTSFYLFQMPVFFKFLNIKMSWGIQTSSCPGNHQTYLHAPGCYDYRSDI